MNAYGMGNSNIKLLTGGSRARTLEALHHTVVVEEMPCQAS
jgi:hypothetical protein